MFTGLIQHVGRLASVERRPGGGRLAVRTEPFAHAPAVGDSIAVQGVCLTVTGMRDDILQFDILHETFEKTNLSEKRAGDALNLEPALRFGDPLGGHIVSGHVDGTGRVEAVGRVKEHDREIWIACGEVLLRDIVPKGSVACDGVSLTVVEVTPAAFSVHIIPHTWTHTSFADLREGSTVNLETDILAKYARAALSEKGVTGPLSWEELARLYPPFEAG